MALWDDSDGVMTDDATWKWHEHMQELIQFEGNQFVNTGRKTNQMWEKFATFLRKSGHGSDIEFVNKNGPNEAGHRNRPLTFVSQEMRRRRTRTEQYYELLWIHKKKA